MHGHFRFSLVAALVLLVGLAGEARGQGNTPCEFSRLAMGAGGSATAFGATIDRSVTGAIITRTLDEEYRTGGGLGWLANADFGVTPAWAARVEGSGSLTHVVRHDLALGRESSSEIGKGSAGYLDTRAVTVAAVHKRSPRRTRGACGHVAVGAGAYSFAYRGSRSVAPGIFGALGFEAPAGARRTIAIELRLDVISNHSKLPVAAYDVFRLGVTLTFKRRF